MMSYTGDFSVASLSQLGLEGGIACVMHTPWPGMDWQATEYSEKLTQEEPDAPICPVDESAAFMVNVADVCWGWSVAMIAESVMEEYFIFDLILIIYYDLQ